MKKLQIKLFTLLTIFAIVVGLGTWMILTKFFPELAFKDYPVIPFYFLIVGGVTIGMLTNVKFENSIKLLNKLMVIRGFKIFTTMIIGLIYWLLDRAEIRSFAIMLAAFYFFYLFFEIYIYAEVEKWNKRNSEAQINTKDE